MPWGDGTGPAGMGPMTGRGVGYCSGYGAPGFYSAPGGRGWWREFRGATPGPYGPYAGYGAAPWYGFGRGGRRRFGRGGGRGFGWKVRRFGWW
ncbi:MAG: DUF5320 domain-containing protein [Chloroflexota bacterium]